MYSQFLPISYVCGLGWGTLSLPWCPSPYQHHARPTRRCCWGLVYHMPSVATAAISTRHAIWVAEGRNTATVTEATRDHASPGFVDDLTTAELFRTMVGQWLKSRQGHAVDQDVRQLLAVHLAAGRQRRVAAQPVQRVVHALPVPRQPDLAHARQACLAHLRDSHAMSEPARAEAMRGLVIPSQWIYGLC